MLAIWGLPKNPERFSVTVVRSRRESSRLYRLQPSISVFVFTCIGMSTRRYFQLGENSSGSRINDESLRLITSVSGGVTEENSERIASGIRAFK